MRHTYDFLGNHAMPNPRAMFYFKGLKLKTSILTIAMPKPRALLTNKIVITLIQLAITV